MSLDALAGQVIDKVLGLTKTPYRIAVFKGRSGAAIQMTRPDSDVFAKAHAARPHDLIGIYNQQATREMIVDDLKCVGLQ